MIAWHYTTGQKYKLITQSGILLPADIGVAPPEQPVLWFSTHPRYEPSAKKPPADWWGHVGSLSLNEVIVEKMDGNKRWVRVTNESKPTRSE